MKGTAYILAALCAGLHAADYKSGIDVTYGGTEGVDYMVEQLYHDAPVWDRKVVYIKSATAISMAHNARNALISDPVLGVAASVGQIRYLFDFDGHKHVLYSTVNGTPDTSEYTGPFTLSSQVYADGSPVVGSTGFNPAGAISPQTVDSYYYGHLDEFGDEWHVLSVLDDDNGEISDPQKFESASDGKFHFYVVDPLTPALKVTASGDAQFYTTSPKAANVPKVHAQTTYFDERSGDLDVQIVDINGGNVSYRVVSDPADAVTPYTAAGASSTILDGSDFPAGASYLQYYFNPANVKTRAVVRLDGASASDFPSYGEGQGYYLWGDAAGLADVLTRVDEPSDLHYASFLNMQTDENLHAHADWEAYGGQGWRLGMQGEKGGRALNNAFLATVLGNSASQASLHGTGSAKTYAQYAKEMTIESVLTIDSVGGLTKWKTFANPSQERNVIAYYDSRRVWDAIVGYDFLASRYRSDQHASGMTPVEDHFVRDRLASYALEAATILCEWGGTWSAPGMWGSSRAIAGLSIGILMPSYDSPLYGASGFDGSTPGRFDAPAPDVAVTWASVFVDAPLPATSYPNPEWGLGIENPGQQDYFVNLEGYCRDKVSYFNAPQMGGQLAWLLNVSKMHTDMEFPYTELACLNAANGALYSYYLSPGVSGYGPAQYDQPWLINDRFPAIVAANKAAVVAGASSTSGALTISWLDPNATGTPPPPPSSAGRKVKRAKVSPAILFGEP